MPLFNLSSVTNAYAMFYQCNGLTTVPLFDLSKLQTQSMFFRVAVINNVYLCLIYLVLQMLEVFF